MANYKRKRPKEYTIRYCGSRHCKQDRIKFHGNGRYRYLPKTYKNTVLGDSNHVWRYSNVVEIPN